MTGTKVYVVGARWNNYDSPGDSLLGVFSSKDAALECAATQSNYHDTREWIIIVDTVPLDQGLRTSMPVKHPCEIVEGIWDPASWRE